MSRFCDWWCDYLNSQTYLNLNPFFKFILDLVGKLARFIGHFFSFSHIGQAFLNVGQFFSNFGSCFGYFQVHSWFVFKFSLQHLFKKYSSSKLAHFVLPNLFFDLIFSSILRNCQKNFACAFFSNQNFADMTSIFFILLSWVFCGLCTLYKHWFFAHGVYWFLFLKCVIL